MAQGRARATRPTRSTREANPASGRARRGGRTGGGGIPWLGLAVLLAIGAAVVVARTTGFSSAWQARSAEPTLTSVRQAATSTRAASGTQAPAAPPRTMAAAPTAVRAHTTPAPTQAAPGAAPAAHPTPETAVRVTEPPASSTAAPRAQTATPGAPGLGTAAPNTAWKATAVASPPPTATGSAGAAAAAGTAASVALTFDAGADRGYAQDILDLLQSEHVIATFGITGQWARSNPDLVRRIAADGHMVINHTLDHQSFTGVSDQRGGLSATRRRAELEDADAIIAPLVGHSTQPWYRLPYGDDDAQVAADVRPAGYTHKVGWTVDSLGWRGSQAADIVARCLSLAAPGAVYVMHVGRESQDALALPQVIQGLRDKGFNFHRIDQA